MSATQAVTIRRDTSIRHISTERVNDELALIREVGYGTHCRSTGVVNTGGGIKRKQHLACLCVSGIKFPVPFTEEHHVAGNERTPTSRVEASESSNNFTCARVGGPVQAKGVCTGNMINRDLYAVKGLLTTFS